ncbi:MAG: bifunctional biotin--[acetyl-CoA-carboxylase] ligase/biotin operon repressor BirA [Gammaproteobacteria bacterium]
MIDVCSLIRALNDGKPHTGERLARNFGVAQMTISRGIEHLKAMGIEVRAVGEQSHRLARRVDLLDAQAILQSIDKRTRAAVDRIEVLPEVDSTNAHLMRAGIAGTAAGLVCLAERQTEGRGRRGRVWVSPFAANVYMSLLWRFNGQAVNPGRLTTGIGVAVAEALTSLGATEIALKWPNDVLWRRRKLGGILVERAGYASRRIYFVIGIGLNVHMPEHYAPKIGQPWVDLSMVMNGATPSRNEVTARLLQATIAELVLLEHGGRKDLAQVWRSYDCNLGRPVALRTPQGVQRGVVMGIDADGRLLLNCGDRQRAFNCGEISLRSVT